MTRRKPNSIRSIASLLENSPLWLGPLLAITVWLFAWMVVPAILSKTSGKIPVEATLVPLSRMLAWVFAGFLILVWLVIAVKRVAISRMADRPVTPETIRDLSWEDFERYVAEAYRRRGFDVERTGSPVGDAGIDIILRKDGLTTLVQCKHWKDRKVGVRPVRELLGVMASQGACSGVLVTSGRFTSEAQEFGKGNPIQLIDGQSLATLVGSTETGENSEAHASKEVDPGAATVSAQSNPTCPRCGGQMVLRTARRGARAGESFWGCKAYPRCQGTRPT